MSVFAWRTWNLGDNILGQPDDLLHSTAAGTTWNAGVNSATCERYRMSGGTLPTSFAHPAPQADCTCGIWAFKTPLRLLREFGRTDINECVARRIFGVVELAGKIVELELGYRAQHARVVALAAPPGVKINESYGVPVQNDLGELFHTWWDGVQPSHTEWADPPKEIFFSGAYHLYYPNLSGFTYTPPQHNAFIKNACLTKDQFQNLVNAIGSTGNTTLLVEDVVIIGAASANEFSWTGIAASLSNVTFQPRSKHKSPTPNRPPPVPLTMPAIPASYALALKDTIRKDDRPAWQSSYGPPGRRKR